MSLIKGAKVNSYTELIDNHQMGFFYDPSSYKSYSYSVEFGCPGMINIETGERFFSEDIQTYITFPLHCIKLMPFTQEEMDAP